MERTASYLRKRGELETYFDRTAAQAWAKLTSTAPVSGVRAQVRAGRDAIRETLLSWLPADMTGQTVLDAGCGAGQLAVDAARRGAHVIAVDLSQTLVDLARERAAQLPLRGSIEFHVGDAFDPALGRVDHIVAMDSVIHYRPADMADILAGFAARAHRSVLFTFAPRTALLTAMLAAGQAFPRADRSPAIRPITERDLLGRIASHSGLAGWSPCRRRRVKSSFYTSEAMELTRS